MSVERTSNITSYDLVKFAAIILMIVDHVGYYFYPDEMWLRAIGRLSAPIWLFLIGYANTRDISLRWWIGLGILVFTNYMVGQAIMPLNILATMMIARACLDPVMALIARDKRNLYPFVVVMFFLTILTGSLFEYGSGAFILVIAGYLCRHREEMGYSKNDVQIYLLVSAFATFCMVNLFYFAGINFAQQLFIGLALVGVMLALEKFRSDEYPALTEKLSPPLVWFIQLGGRRSLEIYVIHLVILRFIALYTGQDGYALFDFHLF